MKSVYFDHAATTAVDPAVLKLMTPYFSEHYGNPSELHALGRATREAVEQARCQVAAALGAAEKRSSYRAGAPSRTTWPSSATCSALRAAT